MSTQTKLGKLISRFKIGFDDETKVVIDSLKDKLDEVTRALSVKNDSHGDRLLAAMQAEAANDAPQPEFLQLGQWVFEGQDDFWQSAAIDTGTGKAHLHNYPLSLLYLKKGAWVTDGFAPHKVKSIDGVFDITKPAAAIQRQSKNDVEYLSESVPEIQGMDACEIIIDEYDWLSESVPQITQADMQLIFIKNLSECLIQRMHSMNRFSEDDYAIGGDKLMAWDILIYEPLNSYAVLIDNRQKPKIADLLFFWDTGAGADANWNTDSGAFAMLRTITEAELPAFRAALEACYA